MCGAMQKPITKEIKFLQKPREQKGPEEKACREGNKAGARCCNYCGEVHSRMVLVQPSVNTAGIVASEITLQAFIRRKANNALVETPAP